MTAKVSVVIPTYNYGRFIQQSIEGVLAQSHPIFEIIVVDDGSKDNTEEVVKRFGEKVRYIKQANAGVCAARNNGVKAAGGDFIAFLDADDIWFPEKIEKQMAKFESDSEIGLVHCAVREFDSNSGEVVRLYLEGEEGWVANSHLLFERPVIIPSGSVIMVSRIAFETVGGFDTNLKVGEDWDFCYQVARKFKVGFAHEVLVNYRNHGGNTHLNIAEMERSMKISYQKAFDTDDESVLSIRSESYGNLHKTLAGSYFQTKNYSAFMKNVFKSLSYNPRNIVSFVEFPIRFLKRRSVKKQ